MPGLPNARASSGVSPRSTRGSGHTPLTWRIAALAILFGGGLAGRSACRSKVGRRIVAAHLGILGCWTLFVARTGRDTTASVRRIHAPGQTERPRSDGLARSVGPAAPGNLPELTVLVPARDEAAVIGDLICDLAAQDHRDRLGSPRFEVVVVDDRSIDGTGDVVRRQASMLGLGSVARVVRREGPLVPDGKGAALASVPLDRCREVIVVLDADARIEPDFLRIAASHVASGPPAVQARRRVSGAHASLFAGLQADEQTVDARIQRGRWLSGGCSEFRGNAMVIRRDELESVGGWRSVCLTEDLDLSSRLAAAMGRVVAWPSDLEVWETPVVGWSGLGAQRLRWAEGSIRRYLQVGPNVVRSHALPWRARLDFAIHGGQLLVPALAAGIVAAAIADRRPGRAICVLGPVGIGGIWLAYDSLGADVDPGGCEIDRRTRIGRAAGLAAFEGLWFLVVPVALWRLATRRGGLRYAKTTHRRPRPLSIPARRPAAGG